MGLNLKKAWKKYTLPGLIEGGVRSVRNNDPNQPDTGNVFKQHPGGMANFYDDSWGSLLGSLEGGADASETLTKLLRDFQGKPGDLEDWMQQAAPFIQASQANALKK